MAMGSSRSFQLLLLLVLVAVQAVRAQEYVNCNTTDQLIPARSWCDDHEDCSDGSDEEECGSSGCNDAEFACDDGSCIASALYCDGVDHCPDSSDENQSCMRKDCTSNEFQCKKSRICIRSLFECDGADDCPDASDEHDNCTMPTIPPTNTPAPPNTTECGIGQFYCGVGADRFKCVVSSKMCDGHVDCIETGRDEDEQLCLSLNCDAKDVTCPDKCIESFRKCDGKYDCIDFSDELGCPGECNADQFKCISAGCIPKAERCNGMMDCADDSDEFLCPEEEDVICGINQFRCLDRMGCIPNENYCDDISQCGDNSDEDLCTNTTGSCSIDNGGCQQVCVDLNNTHYCSCHNGYHVSETNRSSCIDVDECSNRQTCSQLCTNTIGSYVCSCSPGYSLTQGGGCQPQEGAPAYLLLGNYLDIIRVNKDPENIDLNGTTVVAIDYHYEKNLMFWIDIKRKTIRKSNLDGTGRAVVLDYGLGRPVSLAVDWINDKIYWTDTVDGRIGVADLDGSPNKILISGLDNPIDIAVDPFSKSMFWIEASKVKYNPDSGEEEETKPLIKRASLDGTSIETIIDEQLYGPSDLTIHVPTSTIIWTDLLGGGIESCNMSGGNREEVVGNEVGQPVAVTVFGEIVYWLDGNMKEIRSVDRRLGENVTIIKEHLYKPTDLVAVHPLVQPTDAQFNNPCAVDNGGCDYLCLLSSTSPSGFSCHCPPGTDLINAFNCSKFDRFLIFTRTEDIHIAPLKEGDTDLTDSVLPIANFSTSGPLDWDSDNGSIFWADTTHKSLSVVTLDGKHQKKIIVGDVSTITGIAVDWITRKLYWADRGLSRISVSNLDGTYASVIINEDLISLEDISVDPMKGVMFIADNGNEFGTEKNPPKIKRANLDGTEVMSVHTVELSDNKPRSIIAALYADYSSQKVYWVDKQHVTINSIAYDGRNHEVLLQSGTSLIIPLGVVYHDKKLYWTDAGRRDISFLNTTNYEKVPLIEERKNLQRLKVFHQNRPKPAMHPCWLNNGGCDELCLSRPSSSGNLERVCACRNGYLLQNDNVTCVSSLTNWFGFASHPNLQWSLKVDPSLLVVPNIRPPPKTPISLDIDLENNMIYWIDRVDKAIYRGSVNGGPRETIIFKGLRNPASLAVDWMGKNLYWADSGTKRIEVSRLNGADRRVLVEGTEVAHVSAIAVDLKSHFMFWTTTSPPNVYRAVMDGSDVQVIVSTGLGYPTAITVDNQGFNGQIYVTDSKQNQPSITSYGISGKHTRVVALTGGIPIGIAYDEQYVYWVRSTYNQQELFRAHKTDGSNVESIAEGLQGVRDLKFAKHSSWLMKESLHYPCNADSKCSSLCLPNIATSSEQYTCACSTGIQLNRDQHSCKSVPSLYLLISTSTEIRRLSLEEHGAADVILVNKQDNAGFLDYHLLTSSTGRILWTNEDYTAIMSSDLAGNNIKQLQSNFKALGGIAVDWITGNVYYTDTVNNKIGVVNKLGTYHMPLIDTAQAATSIAVEPRKGLMFWLSERRLMRASMDGDQVRTLRDGDQMEHLALDYEEERILWFNKATGTIDSVNYSGKQYKQIRANTNHILSITVHEGFVFWIDGSNEKLIRAMKSDGHNINTVYQGVGLRKVTIVSAERPGEVDGVINAGPCSYKNGGCSHFCIPISSTFRACTCPDNTDPCQQQRGIPPAVPITMSSINLSPSRVSSSYSSSSSTSSSSSSSSSAHQPTNTSSAVKTGLSSVELVMLLAICSLVFLFFAILAILLFIILKRKSLQRYRVDINPPVSAWNPLYKRTQIQSSSSISESDLTELGQKRKTNLYTKVRKESMTSFQSTTPLEDEIKSPSDNGSYEGPEMYKMTPVYNRKSMTSSPAPATITVTCECHSTLAPPPPLPPKPRSPIPLPKSLSPLPIPKSISPVPTQKPKELISCTVISRPTTPLTIESQSKSVKFAVPASPEPPPIPPRS